MDKPIRPQAPYEWNYRERVERKYIYSFTEKFRSEDDDWDDDEEEDGKEELPTKPVQEVNLEWLVSQVPPGISLSQIKMEFAYHASDMAYEDHWIQFYYEVTIPAQKEEYKALEKEYKKSLKQYEKDMVAYEAFLHQEKIGKMEKDLEKLKKGKK